MSLNLLFRCRRGLVKMSARKNKSLIPHHEDRLFYNDAPLRIDGAGHSTASKSASSGVLKE
jgi:hypothetical protein